MKKRILSIAALLLAVVIVSLCNVSAAPVASEPSNVKSVTENKVVNLAGSVAALPEVSKVLQSRFLNMLNHSFVYGSDFDTVEAVVNSSVVALLDLRENEEDSYIKESLVADYVFDMYGIEDVDFASLNPMFEQREGYVFILPRGYSLYSHEIVSVVQNEDSSYTVKTNVTVTSHDSEPYTELCTSLIVANERSAFGYSIVSSVIGPETAEL